MGNTAVDWFKMGTIDMILALGARGPGSDQKKIDFIQMLHIISNMMEGGRKKPMCKKCCTPMKGHKRGVCRPTTEGGTSDTPAENQVIIVPISQILMAPPPGTCPERDAFLASFEPTAEEPEEPKEAEEPKDEWKPLTDESMWNYYRSWQRNSAFVPFPTRMGMTSAQLGDIMENYSKYAKYYR